MLTLVVSVVVLLVFWYLVSYIGQQFGAPPPFFVVVNVLFALIALLWLVQALGLVTSAQPFFR